VSGRSKDPVALARQLLQDLSDETLNDFAGDKAFARGKTYAASGAVKDIQDLLPTPDHLMGVQATVLGTEPYNTEIWWLPDDDLNGDCDCPQGQEGLFCKHQVALAMVWRARLGGNDATPDPDATKKVQAAAKRAQTRANNIEVLRQFVFAQKPEDLAALLWRMADWDTDLMAQLKGWHAQSLAQARLGSGDAKAAQAAVRELLKNPKGYLDPRDCGPYLRRAEQMFPIIESVLKQSPAKARALCEDALKRLYKVGETADDSWGGEFGDLIPRTGELLKRCLQADPPPANWLNSWLALADQDPWGLVPAHEIVAAAGPAVQKAYSAQLAANWHEWQAAHPPNPDRWDSERQRRRSAYLADLKRQGDDATAWEVMRTSVSTASEWDELVQWCEDHHRWREAFDWADKGFKLHPQDWRLEGALLRAYERDGYDQEALAIWRKRLERNPSSTHYQAALKAATCAGLAPEDYRAELMAWAASRESQELRRGYGPRAPTEQVMDVSVRVHWLFDAEGDVNSALALVQAPGVICQSDLLHRFALALPEAQASEAAGLLLRLLHSHMQQARSPYHQELKLVRQICERLPPPERRAALAQLRAQYKAKRHFIQDLPVS
jgi:tetratricopeptide (TPR) repeat protein